MRNAGRVGLVGAVFVLACGGSSHTTGGGAGGGSTPRGASLTVSVTGPGGVDFDVTGAAVIPPSCHGDGQCTVEAAVGATVTVHAHPDAGAKFDGWAGLCGGDATRTQDACSFQLADGGSLSATFELLSGPPSPPPPPPPPPGRHAITVQLAGDGKGHVTSAPAGVDCGSACSASFGDGAVVTLTAAADEGSTFSGWSGACSGSAACQLTVSTDVSATATFAKGGGASACRALAPSIGAGRALRVDPPPDAFGPALCWRGTTSPSGQLALGTLMPGDHRIEAWFDLYRSDGTAHQGTIQVSPYARGSNLDEFFHPTSAGWAGVFEGGLRAYDEHGNTLSGFHEAWDTAPDAHGGTVAIVTPMFAPAPSSPRALVWVGPGGAVLRTAALDASPDLLLVSWMTDHVLAIDSTPVAGPSARWYDGSGTPLTPWFAAGPRFQGAPSMHLLVDGTIAVGDAQGWRVFRDGSAAVDAPPAWLAARAGMRLATLPGGRGYAVLPYVPVTAVSPPETSFEIVTATGESCGTFQLPAPADEPGISRTPALLDVGQDGTLVQAETLSGAALGSGTHCEFRWWPGLLR